MTIAMAELTLIYPGASTASDETLNLVTAGGRERLYFDGFAEYPIPAARALACVARVAATRFFEPASMIAARIRAADPVVTAEPDRLRFESFSLCCGVHARFDLTEEGLDVRAMSPGTTNVDFNEPMLAALGRIGRRDPVRMTVGHDGIGIQTPRATVVERRVDLPDRWVKGFGEVQVALAGARPVLEFGEIQTRRFLTSLPGGQVGRSNAWAIHQSGSVSIVRTWRAGAVCVAGTGRLRTLEPLARYATRLRAFADPEAQDPSPVAWVLDLPGGRLSLTLSPEPSRGFSGEGGLLLALASPSVREDADAAFDAIGDYVLFSPADVAVASGLDTQRVDAALAFLGVHGQLGYDAVDAVFYRRRLPFPDDVLDDDPPRLRDAHSLVADGGVHAAGRTRRMGRQERRV